jgi:DNA-directed RNA polymerase specialized sigma24 family protein
MHSPRSGPAIANESGLALRQEEKALVARMLAGDETAMEQFADGYFPGLYCFAVSRLQGDSELAREIVQTTVCHALAKLETYRGEAPLFTWLCACCLNEIRMHFRRKGRLPRMIGLDEGRIWISSRRPPWTWNWAVTSPAAHAEIPGMCLREVGILVPLVGLCSKG